jgi:2-methylcitrate dehydratase PrpD
VEAIEGRHGFLVGYAPSPDPTRITQDLGTVFETMATGIKPYPSCRYGHAGIDAVLALRGEHSLQPEEVDSIVYGLSHAGLLLVGKPIEGKRNPQNIVGAQFSAPFVLSKAMATGQMGWYSYRSFQDSTIRTLMAKVNCVHDPEIEAEFPANMSGKITVVARGQQFSKTVIVPLDEPANFLDRESLLAKFQGLVEPVLGAAWQSLADAALRLDALPGMDVLFAAGMTATHANS